MTERQHLSWVEKEAKRDYIPKSARGGEGASIIGIMLAALFFYAHQAWSTGFFMPSFGPFEAFMLYGAILLGMAGPVARMVIGSRNSARVPEILASIFWIFSSVVLFVSFPFDFAHFADVIPDFLRFLVTWITNDIARVLFALGIVGGVVFTVINAGLYMQVRKLLRPRSAG